MIFRMSIRGFGELRVRSPVRTVESMTRRHGAPRNPTALPHQKGDGASRSCTSPSSPCRLADVRRACRCARRDDAPTGAGRGHARRRRIRQRGRQSVPNTHRHGTLRAEDQRLTSDDLPPIRPRRDGPEARAAAPAALAGLPGGAQNVRRRPEALSQRGSGRRGRRAAGRCRVPDRRPAIPAREPTAPNRVELILLGVVLAIAATGAAVLLTRTGS